MNVDRLLRKKAKIQAKYDETFRIVEWTEAISMEQKSKMIRWSGKIAVINERLRFAGFTSDGAKISFSDALLQGTVG